MSPAIAAILTVATLVVWHLRTRRHPNWSVCPDGRFYITIGYPAVVIAAYWLLNSSTATGLEWAIGNLWALGAMVSFRLWIQCSPLRTRTTATHISGNRIHSTHRH